MTQITTFATAGAALGLALFALTTGPAAAQEASGDTAQESAQESAPAESGTETGTETGTDTASAYSDEQLRAFVAAALEVAELRQGYQDRIEEATDAAAQQAIVDEANAEILAIVEEADGISVEDYIEIGQTAAADPALNARIVALMQEEAPAPAD